MSRYLNPRSEVERSEQAAYTKAELEAYRKGFEEGKKEGTADTLLLLLKKKFKTINPEYKEKVLAASTEDLEQWCERTLECSTIEDVFQ